MKTSTYLLVCGVMALLVLLVAQMTQPRLSYHEGRGFDGEFYARVAEQIESGQTPRAKPPFVYRIATPALVAHMPGNNVVSRFYRVNLLACMLLALALAVWFRLWFDDPRICIALVAVYCTQWHAPLRFTAYYPCMVDPGFMAVYTAGLIALETWRRTRTDLHFVAFGALLCIALLFREIAALLSLAFFFADEPLAGLRPLTPASLKTTVARFCTLRKGAVAFLTVVVIAAPRYFVLPEGTFPLLWTANFWLTNKSLCGYVYGVFNAFGPAVFVLLLFGWRTVTSFLALHSYMTVQLAALAVLGWIGGSDTERILYWGAPLVLLCVGRAAVATWPLLRTSRAVLVTLVLTQAIAQRLPWTMPDFPNFFTYRAPLLTIPTSSCIHFELYATFAIPQTQIVGTVQYVAVIGLCLILLSLRQSSKSGRTAAKQEPPGA